MNELTLSEIGRTYGAVKDRPDQRDRGMLRFTAPPARPLPAKISHAAKCGPVKDQGQLGACTGFAGTAHREFLARQYKAADIVLSPMYLYWRERELEGTVNQDSGAQIRSCVWVLNHYGTCLESSDEYAPARFTVPPTAEQTEQAAQLKTGAYHRLSTVDDMKSCLAYGNENEQYTFVAGFAVYSSFESAQVARDGLMPVPNVARELLLGGHAVHFMGYDDTVRCPGTRSAGAFQVQNSWGRGWGQDGHFWFPYECAADPNIMWDAWMSHLGKAW